MIGHIAEAVSDKCYALSWSYGEICCHCGCCSDDPLTRAKARLAYHEEELENNKNFSGWFEDDPEIMALQKRNVELCIKYEEAKVKEYREEVRRLEAHNGE